MTLGILCSGCLSLEHQVTSPGASGVVLDAQTCAPLSGAAVVVSRSSSSFGTNLLAISNALTYTRPPTVTTGKNGRFRIPAEQHWKLYVDWLTHPPIPPGGTLIVQRAGYESTAILLEGAVRKIGAPPPTNFISVLLSPANK
jgi:hypothetical protein